MLSFFRRRRGDRPSPAHETVPCPHCGAEVRATAAACRACGYDWEADLEGGESYAEDEFDYDDYLAREFGSDGAGGGIRGSSLTARQQAIALLLVIVFVLALLAPLWF